MRYAPSMQRRFLDELEAAIDTMAQAVERLRQGPQSETLTEGAAVAEAIPASAQASAGIAAKAEPDAEAGGSRQRYGSVPT
jgi:type II secretory pathway component PulM